MPCLIARTLYLIGEPWSPLILRDVWVGIRRFDQIQRDLGVSTKVLAERLKSLVANGVLEAHPYSERPLRHEYVLTEKGSELCTVLMALTASGRSLDSGRRRAAHAPAPPRLRQAHATPRCAAPSRGGLLDGANASPSPARAPPPARRHSRLAEDLVGEVAVERTRPRAHEPRLARGGVDLDVPGSGMPSIVRPSISTVSGALAGSTTTRSASPPSMTSERSGLPCAASGVTTIACSDGATAGPPAPTV